MVFRCIIQGTFEHFAEGTDSVLSQTSTPRYPKLKTPLKKLQTITERKISLIKSTTGDVAAINVEKASLASLPSLAAAQLSSVAVEYCFVRLSDYHRFERFAVIERNFQDAKGRELLHVEYPATETEGIIRKSPMEKAMSLAVKISKNSGGAI